MLVADAPSSSVSLEPGKTLWWANVEGGVASGCLAFGEVFAGLLVAMDANISTPSLSVESDRVESLGDDLLASKAIGSGFFMGESLGGFLGLFVIVLVT
jgi:hypothetical protein